MVLRLAHELGKFEWEIYEYMPTDELARWIGYFKYQATEDRKQGKKRRPTIIK